ncbi:hypothetical protein C8R44DRAFT_973360, partial [Mycena epipterygia]
MGREGREGGGKPGRVGKVYALGSFAGLWSGTMLMPSEPPYTALVAAPGGAFPPRGLARDDLVAAARPVYMRIAEHWSFHPHAPAPPPAPDARTMSAGWLPAGARVVGVGGGRVEVRVPASGAAEHGPFEPGSESGSAPGPISSFAAPSTSSLAAGSGYRAGGGQGGRGNRGQGGGGGGTIAYRRGAEDGYVYETVREGRVRAGAHDGEVCPGCVGGRERERERERARRGAAEEDDDVSLPSPPSSSASSSSQEPPAGSADWPEWDTRAWAGHRFADDDGWEGACDGVQDVVFTGATDPHHGMAWHHYEYNGRVRPWDGLIGLVMRPVLHIIPCIRTLLWPMYSLLSLVLHVVLLLSFCSIFSAYLPVFRLFLLPHADLLPPQRDRTLGLATYFI